MPAKFEIFFGHDLLGLAPLTDQGELDISKLGGFAVLGWLWNQLITEVVPRFWVINAIVPLQAIFVLWAIDMMSGLIKSYRYLGVPVDPQNPEGPRVYTRRQPGQPWWDGKKALTGLHRLVWLWTPVICITYTLRSSHLAGMPSVATVFEAYVVAALALSAITNLAIAAGSKGLQRVAQKSMEAAGIDRDGG